MARNLEIEAKFKLAAPVAMRARLLAAGFRIATPRRREINWIFDDARGSLRRAGMLLRLRHSGDRWILTAKGKRRPGPLKFRPEVETAVTDGPACRALLELLGFRAALVYRRWRTVWGRSQMTVEIAWDETPFGIFMEIEASARLIRSTARQLGLDLATAEPRSYPDLYREWSRRR